MTDSHLYERDFYAWANEQAALLRAGRLSDADILHIAEEIESMGENREAGARQPADGPASASPQVAVAA